MGLESGKCYVVRLYLLSWAVGTGQRVQGPRHTFMHLAIVKSPFIHISSRSSTPWETVVPSSLEHNIPQRSNTVTIACSTVDKANMLNFPEDVYWLALSQKYTDVNLSPLLNVYREYGSLKYLWEGTIDFGRIGMDKRLIIEIERIKSHTRLEDYEGIREHLEDRDIRLLKFPDPGYPSQLKDLSPSEGPPIALYRLGNMSSFDRCVSIVGTRVLSHYGHSIARRLARLLATRGYTVVSGLARGTDTEAHCGALEAPRGRTIAVTPWIEPVYPSDNEELASDIAKRGCILSEFLHFSFGARVAKSAFVKRNRITSGLSQCLIVIESDDQGGTVHQVRFAISQRRKVFVLVPRSGNLRARRGYELFLKLGATPFETATPIFDFLDHSEADRGMEQFLKAREDLRTHLG